MRDFFYSHGFIETETAVRIAAPAPEEYIEAVTSGRRFLRTSPELEMKRLLADGMKRIFQIGSCFRSGEYGSRHREEFTMLEFYASGLDYLELAALTGDLLAETTRSALGKTEIKWKARHCDMSRTSFITVEEAFRKYAGVDAFEADRDDSFDEIMVTKVEPNLGKEHPEFLIDYPARRASLSRLSKKDTRIACRWELYALGMELANAFWELTDAAEQRARFRESAAFRLKSGMNEYPEPTAFLEALDRGLPDSSGCALGVDRLAMLLCGAEDIGEVRFE
ncbi:MAG: EF-P lysine aminoacylase GenX [Victivallaceae bacterium]|nr:EF-P lysine aminoacylase GenX [Victivallaceae bacterium]